jgi:hypothetical protein
MIKDVKEGFEIKLENNSTTSLLILNTTASSNRVSQTNSA